MICKLLNYSFGLTSRFAENTRSKIRTGLYFVLFFVALLYAASVLNGVHLLIKCLVGAGLMGLIILFTVNGTVRRVKWNTPLAVMWFGMGLLQLVSGIFVSLEYLPMAMIWLVAFPVLFLVWNNRRDYLVLFKEVALAGNACFVFLGVTSVLFYPMNVLQYGGFVNNPNGMGQWATFAFPLIVYLHYQESNPAKKWMYRAEIAMLLLLCFAAKGRTAILAVGLMTVVLAVLRLVSNKNNLAYYARQGARLLLCSAVVWALCLTVNLIPQAIANARPETGMNFPTEETQEFTEENLEGGEQTPNAPMAKPTGVGAMTTGFIDRMLGLDKGGTSLNDYSSGRIGIWVGALETMNFLGHPSRVHIITQRNGDVGSNVHNVILQWCYDNGLFAGLLFTVMMIWAGIVLLKRSLRKDNLSGINSYLLITHAGFCCTALFASVGLPFLYLISFLYYLSFAVLFDCESK